MICTALRLVEGVVNETAPVKLLFSVSVMTPEVAVIDDNPGTVQGAAIAGRTGFWVTAVPNSVRLPPLISVKVGKFKGAVPTPAKVP